MNCFDTSDDHNIADCLTSVLMPVTSRMAGMVTEREWSGPGILVSAFFRREKQEQRQREGSGGRH